MSVPDPVCPGGLLVVYGANAYPPQYQYASPPNSSMFSEYNITSGAQHFTVQEPTCVGDPFYSSSGFAWYAPYGVFIIYYGYGNEIAMYNPQSRSVVTAYGTIPSKKCIGGASTGKITIGSTKGVDYPNDPDDPSNYAGTFGRFRCFDGTAAMPAGCVLINSGAKSSVVAGARSLRSA